MNKNVIIAGLVIITVFLGVVAASKTNISSIVNNSEDDTQECTMEARICPDGSSVGRTGPNCTFSECPVMTGTTTVFSEPLKPGKHSFTWMFTNLGEDETGAPITQVIVIADERPYDLGKVQGACKEIDGASWSLYEGEKNGVICFWAGGGVEFGIFEEDGKVIVKKGELDEGTAETESFRGNFKTLIVL